jgi:hypothetical protein
MRPQWGQAMGGELFMWGFALAYVLFVATGSGRVLMWGCIAATAVVLLMRQVMPGGVKKQAAT